MNKDRFTFVCNEAEQGRDAFVTHPATDEEGRVLNCSIDHVVVETGDGNQRCWDFRNVGELSRDKNEFPYR
jgi:hypothetical protein